MKDELATRSSGVDLLRQTDELDTTFLEALEQFDQMGQRAPSSIQFPHDQCISWSQICQSFIKPFALCFGASHFIQKPFVASRFFQRIYLECLMLLLFGDTYIANFHILFLLSHVSRQLSDLVRL